MQHIHPFLKIRTVEQTPVKIIAVVKDQENNFEVNGFKIPSQSGFENLIDRGMSFLSNMSGHQPQQGCQSRCQPDPRCNFFKNLLQGQFKNFAQQHCQKQEQKEEKKEPTEEEKVEKKKMEEGEANEEKILENAQYLSQYGFDFNKCYSWARTYPKMEKEELLETCLATPGFLESK